MLSGQQAVKDKEIVWKFRETEWDRKRNIKTKRQRNKQTKAERKIEKQTNKQRQKEEWNSHIVILPSEFKLHESIACPFEDSKNDFVNSKLFFFSFIFEEHFSLPTSV
jgi:hypothetical protein